jgi:hypothetical protein
MQTLWPNSDVLTIATNDAGCELSLYGRKAEGRRELVSKEDFEWANQWHWSIGPKGYVIRTDRSNGKRTLYLHKEIGKRMGFPAVMQADHRNTNKLDARRSNLRAATNQLNQANVGRQKNNTTGFKGVTYRRKQGRWPARYIARIGVSGTRVHLGCFETAEEAHAAYCAAAAKYFGDFARFN